MATETKVIAPVGSGEKGCCKSGPGYATPLAAMSGPREKLIYVIAYNFFWIGLNGILRNGTREARLLGNAQQHIVASFIDCQCPFLVMSFIILVGTLAVLAMVMLLLIDVISCYHPLYLVASMQLTQRQTRGHHLCIST
ncbi:BnaUnng04320D [Brassica napus]|uniref:BnaUnng04320D protein n=1 Tax=Brassica napus TaxID=3708 RepID=A0A078JUY7_BRANA|nr:BnaUnng04320D [Brassica napus]